MRDLPAAKTVKGYTLAWRNGPLRADHPAAAWHSLLEARGMQESDPFFSPCLADLPNPLDMCDMDKAATRLAAAVMHGEHIHIFGDFDADGVNGTAILLEALRATGVNVSFSIPHRADEGHGIGVEPVQAAVAAGAKLGISVDTGTTCFEACRAARELGFDLIVSDHHLPETELPDAFALLNPARVDCGFADRKLCGTGVAFFLLMAVWQKLAQHDARPDFDLRQLLDRVAVATIADVMDIVGVNRILVYHGLQRLNANPSTGMQALLKVAKIKKTVSAETIGFYLAPRINAAGRLQHGEAAMRLLSTHDNDEAMALARELDETNKQRRLIEAEAFKQAELILGDAVDVLAVYDQRWHAGVVGLVAGRLARKHGKPAAVGFVTADGAVRVSLRGTPGFHVGNLLDTCSAHLTGFGGHAGAGGGTIRAGQWDAFTAAFSQAVNDQAVGVEGHLLHRIDGELSLGCMHIGLAERLARFEPLGRGNPACSWLLKGLQIADRRDLKGGVTRLKLTDGNRWLDGIIFGAGRLGDAIEPGLSVSVIGQLQKDDWRGNGAVQFVIEDVIAE